MSYDPKALVIPLSTRRPMGVLRILEHPLGGGLARAFSRVSWLPVRVRQWPYNFLDGLCQREVARAGGPCKGGFHFVFFTCKTHFHLLECAVGSLIHLKGPWLIGVSVFVDDNDFLDQGQVSLLTNIYNNINIEKWPRITGWGVRSASREIRAFAKVGRALGEDDYLVKADSDLLFIAPWIFPLVLKSGADAVGDGRHLDFRMFQGGCYFLRRPIARLLEPYGDDPVLAALYPGEARDLGEDEYMYNLARRLGASPWLTRFMAFPDEFARFKGRGGPQASKFCAMHFTKLKDSLPAVYQRDVLPEHLRGT